MSGWYNCKFWNTSETLQNKIIIIISYKKYIAQKQNCFTAYYYISKKLCQTKKKIYIMKEMMS